MFLSLVQDSIPTVPTYIKLRGIGVTQSGLEDGRSSSGCKGFQHSTYVEVDNADSPKTRQVPNKGVGFKRAQ